MRICDICFCEMKEEGTYEIKDGVRRDNCGKCLQKLKKAYAESNPETENINIAKEYEKFINMKDNNIETLLLKISAESSKRYGGMLIQEQIKDK